MVLRRMSGGGLTSIDASHRVIEQHSEHSKLNLQRSRLHVKYFLGA